MTTLGYDKPLYILPFDHRGSFQTKLFGWPGMLTSEQTAEIAASKQVIYDGFRNALDTGVPAHKAGILVDEQFGSAILDSSRGGSIRPRVRPKRAARKNSISNTATISQNTSRPSSRRSARFWCVTTRMPILLSTRGRRCD